MDLAATARRQGGLFTRAQALASGLSNDQVDRRLASGRWVAYFPHTRTGVLSAASTPASREARVWASLLAAGPTAAIGVASAAWLWIWCDEPPLVHVVVRKGVNRSVPGQTRLWHVARPDDVVRLRGIPVTSKVGTLVDCLRLLPRGEASDILDRSQQRNGPPLAVVAASLPRRSPGSPQARALLAAADGSLFEAERRCAGLLREAGISGWVANHPVRVANARFVLDFAFPDLLVAVEIDGFAHHHDPSRFQRDRQKQNALVGAGWLVLRFTWRDLTERPDAVAREIRAAIAGRVQR